MTDGKEERDLEKRKADVVSADKAEDERDTDAPPSPPEIIREFMAAGFASSGAARAFHPVFDKFNDGHVDKFLDQSHTEEMQRLQLGSRSPYFTLAYVVLGTALLGFLVVYLLPADPSLLNDILKILLGFAGGFGGGYGFRAYQQARRFERR